VSQIQSPAGARRRNPRGEGSRLRQDILDAAAEILEETGREDAVTLRAVARKVGIAAPSIYAHFDDREAILDGLVEEGFRRFTAMLEAAGAGLGDPVDRLFAGCRAYLAYAAKQPSRYAVLFHHPHLRDRDRGVDPEVLAQGAAALDVLVRAISDCAAAGESASEDHFATAVAVWVALHGLATLRAVTSASFPWPDGDRLVTDIVGRLARLVSSR